MAEGVSDTKTPGRADPDRGSHAPVGAEIGRGILVDIALFGLRLMLGVTFIVHGFPKFGNERFAGVVESFGLPPEYAIVVAIGEFAAGVLLLPGILSRISASVIAAIMMIAMIVVRNLSTFTGDGGYELDLALLAAALLVIVAGPGRISVAHMTKSARRYLH